MNSPAHEELFDLRMKAGFRSNQKLVDSWARAVIAAQQVQDELFVMGWTQTDRVYAINQLCVLLMSMAPDCSQPEGR